MTDPDTCAPCAIGAAESTSNDLAPQASSRACCALEAVVSVDERGQLVLPKDLRVRAGIGPGDRLAVVSNLDEEGSICCITLVKAGAVASAVRAVIGPVFGID